MFLPRGCAGSSSLGAGARDHLEFRTDFFFPFKDQEKCSQMEPLEAVADLVALGFPVPGWSPAALDALSEEELLPTALRTWGFKTQTQGLDGLFLHLVWASC